MANHSLNSFIFDLDDTLCSYGINVEEALNISLKETGLPPSIIDREDLKKGFKEVYEEEINNKSPVKEGFRRRVFLNVLRDRNSIPRNKIIKLSDCFRDIRENELHLVKGAIETINRLSKDKRIGLLTNGPSALQWRKIEILNIQHLFDTIVVSGDQGISKPDPRIFIITLDKINEEPRNSAYIGNSMQYDITGAKKAGMVAIWVKNGEEEPSSDDPTPDLTIENLGELTDDLLQELESS